MTPWENTSINEEIDISQYENVDLSQLNSESSAPSSLDTLMNILTKVVYFSRIWIWVCLWIMIVSLLYAYTRYQLQSSWLMQLPINKTESFICRWMNHGLPDTLNLKATTEFREFLSSEWKKDILNIIEQDDCRAIDTLVTWLEMQIKYETNTLREAYESILPKKFIWSTISSSPELIMINNKSPSNRVHHDVIIHLLSEAAKKHSDESSKILCREVRFYDLNSEARCEVFAVKGVQPRAKAMSFMDTLNANDVIDIIYPNQLDMYIDSKTWFLKTNFTVNMTYIPSRYEDATLQKLTYEKR